MGTRFEDAGRRLRWLLGALTRHRHPELWELYLEERQIPHVLQRLLSRDSCGVDVGAHIGSFLSLLLKYAPDGRHVAVEASQTRSRWLQARFPTVDIVAKAVADRAGTGIFKEDPRLPGFSRLRMQGEAGHNLGGSEVMVTSLDDVLINRTVDLIKLDIEGGELAALRGAVDTIKKWQPVIIFECASEYSLQAVNGCRADLYHFLTDTIGYRIYGFTDFLFRKGHMEFPEFRKCGLYPFRAFNFIALPAARNVGTGLTSVDRTLDYSGM
ncbi:MAG TPA: FkbM family methyltransferase [Steroidobacteraceae bacterium]|nr:FkbM family methyltransferase [Steroidobacteraceae bacterium]